MPEKRDVTALPLPTPGELANLSMAYSEVVGRASAIHESTWLSAEPLGPRVAVQIPERAWQKLASAICAITGGEIL